jgi:ethanolamine utilization cobalamin adenosyltransferase
MKNQEHRTILTKGTVVNKTDTRIEFRGSLDSLAAAVVTLQILGQEQGAESLVQELEAIRMVIFEVMACEATGRTCEAPTLWGMAADEIRDRSHDPSRYFGLGHIRPHYTMGIVAAGLNALRTQVRETELSACRAFEASERLDIVEVLNRLSSAVYVLTYKYLPEGYDKTIR